MCIILMDENVSAVSIIESGIQFYWVSLEGFYCI